MGTRPAKREQESMQVILLHAGVGALPERVMQKIGRLGRGLINMAEWGVPVLPGVVMAGLPGANHLQRAMQMVGVDEGAGRWWLRLDRADNTGSKLRRGTMGGTEVVLDQPSVNDIMEAMLRLARQAPQRWAMGGRRGLSEPGLKQPRAREPGTTFILQWLDMAAPKNDDGAGVGFTRDPATGSDGWVIRFLAGGQGRAAVSSPQAFGFEKLSRQVQKHLQHIKAVLEKRMGTVAEIEFVLVGGAVFVNRLDRAKLSAQAAVTSAVEMAQSGMIDTKQAIEQVDPSALSQLLLPQFEAESRRRASVLAQGFAASPGVAVGRLVFSSSEALRRGSAGEPVILVQSETYAQDVAGMRVCQGVLTSSGGMTSHAAVVARGWGLCAVVGAGGVHVDAKRGCMRVEKRVFTSADTISLDGATGEVLEGAVKVKAPVIDGHVQPLLAWADEHRKMLVLANADTVEDARRARELGAEGIGLCRTEHMFFATERLILFRRLLLGDATGHDRHSTVLDELKAMQHGDFEKLLEVMDGLPVTIRLLDAPMHEFLPTMDDKVQLRALAKALGISERKLQERMAGLRETNPMLGLRGCRLSLLHPEVLAMQLGALVGAVQACRARGLKVDAGVMFPLVSSEEELVQLVRLLEEESGQLGERVSREKMEGRIRIGVMIETPRAAVLAGRLAKHVDFFSLGTNDLTQMTFGFSRDDMGSFLPTYLEKGLLAADPFGQLDQCGVGELIRRAVAEARAANPEIHINLCGEHGGDPASIAFANRIGLDSVSCSPLRLPVARLAAARTMNG